MVKSLVLFSLQAKNLHTSIPVLSSYLFPKNISLFFTLRHGSYTDKTTKEANLSLIVSSSSSLIHSFSSNRRDSQSLFLIAPPTNEEHRHQLQCLEAFLAPRSYSKSFLHISNEPENSILNYRLASTWFFFKRSSKDFNCPRSSRQ